MKTKLKLTGSASEVFGALRDLRGAAPNRSSHIWRGDRQLNQPIVIHLQNNNDLANPTGTLSTSYEWGYEGAGPQALANQILTTLYGEDTALEFGYDFKVDVISQLPDSWILTTEDVAIWIEKRRAV